MEFTDYSNDWAKSEVLQGRTMIGIGIFLSIVFVVILRSDNALLKGSIIPLSLLLALLLGYGSYMLYSRPAHAKEIIRLHKNLLMKLLSKKRQNTSMTIKQVRCLCAFILC